MWTNIFVCHVVWWLWYLSWKNKNFENNFRTCYFRLSIWIQMSNRCCSEYSATWGYSHAHTYTHIRWDTFHRKWNHFRCHVPSSCTSPIAYTLDQHSQFNIFLAATIIQYGSWHGPPIWNVSCIKWFNVNVLQLGFTYDAFRPQLINNNVTTDKIKWDFYLYIQIQFRLVGWAPLSKHVVAKKWISFVSTVSHATPKEKKMKCLLLLALLTVAAAQNTTTWGDVLNTSIINEEHVVVPYKILRVQSRTVSFTMVRFDKPAT